MANEWGALPQFSSIAGYGMPSMDVPVDLGGVTSPGAPAIALNSYAPVAGGSGSNFLPNNGGGGIFDSFLPQRDTNGNTSGGFGLAGMGIAQGLLSGLLGMKQYGLAKDQLAFSKEAFNKNYAAQKTMTNSNMADRQAARVASNPTAYQSVGDYMKQNGIA